MTQNNKKPGFHIYEPKKNYTTMNYNKSQVTKERIKRECTNKTLQKFLDNEGQEYKGINDEQFSYYRQVRNDVASLCNSAKNYLAGRSQAPEGIEHILQLEEWAADEARRKREGQATQPTGTGGRRARKTRRGRKGKRHTRKH